MSKINVHPDHYKVGGRDRQDDAAAARLARAKAAKAASQKRPDRMAKKPWLPRAEAKPAAGRPPAKAAPKKGGARKASGGARRPTKRRANPK